MKTEIQNTLDYLDQVKTSDRGFWSYLMGATAEFSKRNADGSTHLKAKLVELCETEVVGIETTLPLCPVTFANSLIDQAFPHFKAGAK